MKLEPANYYRALSARDPRFDGVFFVGVTSTGIYCRPVCPARTPKAGHCRFFPSAAAAGLARFRPCLRCRPELAPGHAPVDALSRTAFLAADLIGAGMLDQGSAVDAIAGQIGISARQLRRALRSVFGVSPVQLAQTRRLLLAKQLLLETNLPIIDVAYSSGFGSLRRFNSLFQRHYGRTPRSLRRGSTGDSSPALNLSLVYRPPLAWETLLDFLRLRAIPGIEWVTPSSYARTVGIGDATGWVRVTNDPARNRLVAEIAPSLLPVLSEVLGRLRRLFDLDAHPHDIASHLGGDPLLGSVVQDLPGVRIPGAFDEFEVAVRAIVGQQVSVRAATTIMGRLVQQLGTPVETPFRELCCRTPDPATLANKPLDDVRAAGLTQKRSECLQTLARSVDAEVISLRPREAPDVTMARLQALPGIGDWTAQYLAMRVLGWPDAFPAGDLILRRVLGCERSRDAALRAESWRPWRAYGCLYAWLKYANEGSDS
jgi:AraC family transcriptional regulator of adaptative response / DNA-3-methyladenine glycosylase II